jgi:tetratricopeptide (TPR) repeat protein
MATDAKGAEESFRKALELAPGHADASIALGALLLDSGRYADADTLYQQLASTSPLAARLGRIEALTGLGQHADARVQLQGLNEAQRSSPVARETAARLSLAEGKPGDAVTLLGPLMQGEKKSPLALALYGEALYGVEQVDAAAGAFEQALELDADLPEALIGRAEVHLRAERADDALGLLEQARDALEKRLRAPEWHARALMAIGHAHLMRGKRNDLDHARNALLKAVALPGAPAEAYFWRGEADGGRRTPEAAAAFKKYLELEPNGRYADRAKKALGPLL